MCLSPLNLRDPKGNSNAQRINVPCGKCAACVKNKQTEWITRLRHELSYSSSALFVTLTYDDEHLPINDCGFPSVSKDDVQKFMKRLRKLSENNLRYYLVAEYGSKGYRPHYHMILFNLTNNIQHGKELVVSAWRAGNCVVGDVNDSSIAYTCKYMVNKTLIPDGCDKTFSLMSRNPGIGRGYIDKMEEWHNSSSKRFEVTLMDGKRVSMPRYYRDKIFSREQLDRRNQDIQDHFKRRNDQEIDNAVTNGTIGTYFQNKEAQKQAFSDSFYKRSKSTSKL